MLDTDLQCLGEAIFAINRIQEYILQTPTKEGFIDNYLTHDAVLMQFHRVPEEPCNRISLGLKTEIPQIDWRGANDFRNFLAHDYFEASDDVVWSIIQFHLPPLKTEFENLFGK